MAQKLDYIFIDLDGPLLDGKLRHYNCYKDIILKDGGTPLEIDIYWDMKRNKVSRRILLEKSYYYSSYEDFYNQWMENIEKKEYLYFDKLKQGVADTLYSWRDFSNSLVLVTMRNNRENLLWQLEEFKLIDSFDRVISGPFNVINSKYELIKNILFSKAIFIGDTEEDENTAKLLSIKFIGITNGIRRKEYLKADIYETEIKYIDMFHIVNSN